METPHPNLLTYLSANQNFWSANTSVLDNSSQHTILVDLMHDNQWYVRLNCLTAKYLQMLHGGKIVGLQHRWDAPFIDYDAPRNRLLALSFGINEIIDLDELDNNSQQQAAANDQPLNFSALRPLSGHKLREALQGLTSNGNDDFGWLSYDTFIRTQRIATIEHYTDELEVCLKEYQGWYRIAQRIADTHNVTHCVLGHVEYLPYAFFAHTTIDRGGAAYFLWPVVPGTMRVFKDRASLRNNRTSDFKEHFDSLVRPAITAESDRLRRFQASFRDRFAVTRGYQNSNQSVRSRFGTREFSNMLDIDPSRPNVCLFSQALSDAVHANGPMIFDDFGQWLLACIDHYGQHPTHNLLIKTHPRNRTYCQDDFVGRLIRQASASDNVRVLANTFENTDIADNAAVGSTVHGTPGYELVLQNLPTVVAGQSRYTELDIAQEATSAGDYFAMMDDPKPLTENTRHTAWTFAYAELNVFRCPSAFIHTAHPRLASDHTHWRDEAARLSAFTMEDDPYFRAIENMEERGELMFVRREHL